MSAGARSLAVGLPNKQVVSNLLIFKCILISYLLVGNQLSTKYNYLLPFIYKQMFISNIIYKLPSRELSAKAITAPTNKDRQSHSTTINTGSIKLFASSHHLSFAHPSRLSIFTLIRIYLLTSPHSYSYLSV